jgi:phage terminase small subunit
MTATDATPEGPAKPKPRRYRRQKYSGAPLAPAVEDMESYGPCMLALTPLQRKFVRELQLGPIGYGSEVRAVKAAGYSGSDPSLRVIAHHLLHNPKIQDALREVGGKMIRAASFQSIRNVEAIANDLLHKDCLRANLALVDRGFPTEAIIHHKVERTPDMIMVATEQVLERIRQLAMRAGLDADRQVEAAKMIDSVAMEVNDES